MNFKDIINMKVTKNFDIREFVSPEIWNRWGEKSIWFVNPWCYEFAQFVKEWLSKEYGEEIVIEINTWSWGGNRKWSCHRTYQYIKDMINKGVKTATLSQHIGGQAHAIDFLAKIKSNGAYIPANDIREKILDNQELMMKHGLTTIESGRFARSWNHCDDRVHGGNEILIVGA